MKMKKLMMLPIILLSLNSIAQTIDYSLVPYRKGDKWGYADAQRNIVITPKYNDAEWFSEGLAAVKIGSKWGYVNKQGKLIIPAKFTVAKSFRKGYMPRPNKNGGDSILFAGASTTLNGYERCITTKGVILTKCPAISENSVIENRIPVQTKTIQKTYSIANNNGLFDKIVDDYKIAGSDETYYVAQKNGMYGVFNSKFETIIPFEYTSVKQLTSNNNIYLQVQKNGRYGIMNANGMADINTDYSNITIVNGANNIDYVILKKDGKTYVKDMMNNDIISLGFSDIVYDNNGGFVVTDNNNMRGFYFSDKRMINPKYSDVKILNRGSNYLQIKTSNGKVGYINAAGDEYFVE
jgi:hypothetical protein